MFGDVIRNALAGGGCCKPQECRKVVVRWQKVLTSDDARIIAWVELQGHKNAFVQLNSVGYAHSYFRDLFAMAGCNVELTLEKAE